MSSSPVCIFCDTPKHSVCLRRVFTDRAEGTVGMRNCCATCERPNSPLT